MESKKPNILFICSDQHRYDCIGYSKAYPVKTPNLDRMADEGMCFSNAYTPIPLCCPARQALLNCKRAETFGALWNYDNGLSIPALNPEEYSWPRELKNIGYINGYVGKWHVNPVHTPIEYGFDDYISEKDYSDYRKSKYPNIKHENGWFGDEDKVSIEDTRTHWDAEKAIEMMGKYNESGKPWHMRLDFYEPHLPCRPAGEFAHMYNPKDIPMWGQL